MKIISRGIALSLFVLNLAGSASAAPTETVIYNFQGGTDGGFPQAGLIADGEGGFYGTTEVGGSDVCGLGCGTVFKLTPPANGQTAWTESVLYSFQGGSDGLGPNAGLFADGEGGFYGTAASGGDTAVNGGSGYGTVFKLTPPANGQTTWTESVLYGFKGGSDGAGPAALLIADGQGGLYGTTANGGSGGCQIGCGTVFKLTPPANGQTAWTESVLYSFKGGSDGGGPYSGVIADGQGGLYGITGFGGSGGCSLGAYLGCGTVFKLTPPANGQTAWTESVPYSFQGGTDGATPDAHLIADAQGALYGTTLGGGSSVPCSGRTGCGTVFKLTPPANGQTAWTESLLYSFKGSSNGDGATPDAHLIADGQGGLYGITGFGGNGPLCGQTGCLGYGTVFELTGTGFVTDIPFAAFRSDLAIQLGRRPNTDAFELLSEFTLGSTSTGVNPLTEPVTLAIGTFTATLPAGSFQREKNGPFYYAGSINGVDLEAAIAQTGEKRFEFAADAWKADLTGTTNPVPVTLTIGSNTGTDSIRLPIRGW